ncbi:hypothetical protein TNCT_678551 [Trichonephila clavata]|uniref:Uncharacterized protein n=1 Tax=Trichonephila clavata TaxID=2740835 RepID=A0A8X6J0U5_TRICU|nr:hypothetical protein TNCT_678551 [Trichonephila clavata]
MMMRFLRMNVKTVKEPLRKILGRSLLSFEELTTLLAEIENIVNLCPLTYVSDDKDDPEPLTPATFCTLVEMNLIILCNLQSFSMKQSPKRHYNEENCIKLCF